MKTIEELNETNVYIKVLEMMKKKGMIDGELLISLASNISLEKRKWKSISIE